MKEKKTKTVDQFRKKNFSTQYTPPLRTALWNLFLPKKLRFGSFCRFYSKKWF